MTKHLLIIISFLFIGGKTYSSEFITRWDLAASGSLSPNSLSLNFESTGPVNYTWETVPNVLSGSGTFIGTNLLISSLPSNNFIIRLKIDPTNLTRILINNGPEKLRLKDIEQWGSVAWTNMANAFAGCENLNISATDIPDLSLVTNMSSMFAGCINLNSPANINSWNTSNVENMQGLFSFAKSFNQPIGNWNTSNVKDMSYMFSNAIMFNQPIGNWNTSNVKTMFKMFELAKKFNQPIGNWNTGLVMNMSHMFFDADEFNQPIGSWNTSNVTDMKNMLSATANFNQPIGTWNTSNVKDMGSMFWLAAAFNQPIGSWDVGNVTNMSSMFELCPSFNQPIGIWNTSNVLKMNRMFGDATQFNQSIGGWNLNSNVQFSNMLDNSGIDCSNYSSTLIDWANDPNIPTNRVFSSNNVYYGTNAVSARDFLINSKGWTIGAILQNSACSPTSNSTIEKNELISIYPNPSQGKFYINCKLASLDNIKLYNAFGALVYSTTKGTSQVDLSQYAKGIYNLIIQTNDRMLTRRLVLE